MNSFACLRYDQRLKSKGAVTKVTVTKKDKEGVDPIREGALLRGKI